MKLKRVRLRNFRCYEDETSIDIDNLTVFVGKNDAGKSAILDAVAIFFDEMKIDSDDASITGNKTDVRIICEFSDFPEALVIDANYPTNLKDEYLLNQNGLLEIHKAYNCSLKIAKLTGSYAFALHPSTDGINDLLLLKNAELKQRAKGLSANTDGIDTKVNTLIRRKIWESVSDLKLEPREIALDQETAKKIWDKLKTYLPAFAIFKSDLKSTDQDDEAQDPMKAAVKEAIKEKALELEEISAHVEKQVRKMADQTVSKLREMNPSLANELTPVFTSNWSNVFKITLTGDGDIPINKRGSGIRRLILLNFFRAKAEQAANEKGAVNVIYAVEEPETSQHPDNQKMLIQAFGELAEQSNCQVMLTTHTPMLARLVPTSSHYCPVNNRINSTGYNQMFQLFGNHIA